MFDRYLQNKLIIPLKHTAKLINKIGITANGMTFIGWGLGLICFILLINGLTHWALLFFLGNRLADGLDGEIARLKSSKPSPLGGFLDTVGDFIFYAMIPAGFVFNDPNLYALAGTFVILSFVSTGYSFLTYAVYLKKNQAITPNKSMVYIGGLAEGFETILYVIIICLWPVWFNLASWIFGGVCLLTAVYRVYTGYKLIEK